jgi:hypothetical protein
METHDWLLIVKNTCQLATKKWPKFGYYVTNFMGYNLAIIVLQNLFFIDLYRIDTNVINLFILFEYWCHVHCLNMNVICLFVFFRHRCCMFILVVYTQKSCTWLPCLKNAWHSCLNNTNVWNNNFTQIWNEPMKLVNLWCKLVVENNPLLIEWLKSILVIIN